MSTSIAAAVTIALAAAPLLVFGQEKANRPAAKIHVSGRVVTVKRAPILLGASVSIHPYEQTDESDMAWGHSDETGRFTLPCKGFKKYELTVMFGRMKTERRIV